MLITLTYPACAEPERVLNALDLTQLRVALEGDQTMPNDMKRGAFDLIKGIALSGEVSITPEGAMQAMGDYVFDSLRNTLPALIGLMIPAVLAGIFSQLGSSAAAPKNAQIAEKICFIAVALQLLNAFLKHVKAATLAVEGMSGALKGLFPVLMTLLSAVGGMRSAGVFEPAAAAAAGIATGLVRGVVINMLIGATVIAVVINLSEGIQLTRLFKLLRSSASLILGVTFTAFLGVMAIRGVLAATYDGISIRTAKYAIDNMVPIIGGEVADAMDTLVSSTLIVKNAFGIAGMVLVVGSCALPLLNLLVTISAYRLTAALLEPISIGAVTRCLDDFADVLKTLFVAVLSTATLFLLMIGAVISGGMLITMLR